MDFWIENGCLTKYTGPDCHVTVPEEVTQIGERAFSGTDITGVTLPANLCTIGHLAFSECKQLRAVTIPSSVTALGQHVFAGCDALETIRIGAGLEKISVLSFSHCRALTTLRIPKTVRRIDGYAFYGCRNLRHLILEGEETEFDIAAFTDCDALCEVEFPDAVWQRPIYWWSRHFRDRVMMLCAIAAYGKNEELSAYVRENAEAAVEHLFAMEVYSLIPVFLSHFERVPLEVLERMERHARALSLVEVLVTLAQIRAKHYPPEVLEEMETARLEGAMGLRPMSEEEWKKIFRFRRQFSIGGLLLFGYTGEGCVAYLPKRIGDEEVRGIAPHLFSDATALEAIAVDADHPAFCSVDGVLYSKDGSTLLAYPQGRRDEEFAVPAGVTRIAPKVFLRHPHLRRVILPEGVAEIGDSAFAMMNALEEVTLPESLCRIDTCAFSGCRSLRAIRVPDGVTELGEKVFWQCRAMEEAYLGRGITDLTSWTFATCHALLRVSLPETLESLDWTAFFDARTEPLILFRGTAAQWAAVEKSGEPIGRARTDCVEGG